MKVLIADKLDDDAREGLTKLGCEVVSQPALDPDSLPAAMSDLNPAVLIVRSTKVQRSAIEAGTDLKLVIRAGAGYDTIDTAFASERSVAVCNCPGTNAVAVAELVMGLLIACDRRIPDQTKQLREGHWNKAEFAKAPGLKGRTLGIVGVGAIGRAVVRRALAFDMRVIAHSLNMTPARAEDLRVQYGGSSREALYRMLEVCDAVSVHVASNPQSEGMCDAAFFDAMKEGAYFINTSRGSIVDEGALADAVRNRGIRAGLDVYRLEPDAKEGPWANSLFEMPGVYGTHHVGASTDQAQSAVGEEVVRIVRIFRDTGQFEHRVNN